MGTKYAIEHFLKAFNWDLNTRNFALNPKPGEIEVTEFNYRGENAVVYDENGVTVRSEGPKTRLDPWDNVPGDVIETLFAEGEGATAYGQVPGRFDAVTVARVAERAPGPETDENKALREQLIAQMNNMAGNDALTLFLTAKQEQVGVSVNQQLLESLLVNSY